MQSLNPIILKSRILLNRNCFYATIFNLYIFYPKFFIIPSCYWWNHNFQTQPDPKPGFRVLTRSPGCSGQLFFLKKLKRRRFSRKKNKSQQVATVFLTGSTESLGQPVGLAELHQVFSYPIFSSSRLDSNPRSAESLVGGLG